jgi:xylulokinase
VVDTVYEPDALTAAVYEKNYRVFKRLYFSNRLNFRIINARAGK